MFRISVSLLPLIANVKGEALFFVSYTLMTFAWYGTWRRFALLNDENHFWLLPFCSMRHTLKRDHRWEYLASARAVQIVHFLALAPSASFLISGLGLPFGVDVYGTNSSIFDETTVIFPSGDSSTTNVTYISLKASPEMTNASRYFASICFLCILWIIFFFVRQRTVTIGVVLRPTLKGVQRKKVYLKPFFVNGVFVTVLLPVPAGAILFIESDYAGIAILLGGLVFGGLLLFWIYILRALVLGRYFKAGDMQNDTLAPNHKTVRGIMATMAPHRLKSVSVQRGKKGSREYSLQSLPPSNLLIFVN